jgi:UPF0755 protein
MALPMSDDSKKDDAVAPTGDVQGAASAPADETSLPSAKPSSGWRSMFSRRTDAEKPKQPASPPPPPKKKKKRDGALSAMSGALSFLLLVAVGGAFALMAGLHKFKEPGPLAEDKVVYISRSVDTPDISSLLERAGVIESWWQMDLALLLDGQRSKIQRGEYLFKQNVSLREVIEQMVAGRVVQHKLTIPEGLTSEQIAQRVRESDVLEGDIKEAPKEGALYPDTYYFPRGHSRSKAIARMQEAQRKVVADIWKNHAADLPIKTPFELVTLASIVEKETGKAEERPRVAAVFINRLRKGMRLQSDPTTVYGLIGGKATLGRGLLRSEIDRYTPYNTYAINGLPPGPIANPGRAALEAAANPARTLDLYFVADGTGGHVFAETLDQHSRNVQRWRQLEQEQKDKTTSEPEHALPGLVAPEKPARDRRSDASPLGRLLALDAKPADYPPGRIMASDAGATHRLGRFEPGAALFMIGVADEPTESFRTPAAALRMARAYFTTPSAQRPERAGFDPLLLAAGGARDQSDSEMSDDVVADAQEDRSPAAYGAGEVSSYPVSPRLRAEQKARAARLGLSTGSDELPSDAIDSRPDAPTVYANAPALAVAGQIPSSRRRVIDASEGTSIDPLRDKSWDLSSAKLVPTGAGYR